MHIHAVHIVVALAALLLTQCSKDQPAEPTQPQMVDYFPLKVGNTWAHEYFYYTYYGGETTTIQGSKVWEIIDVKELPDSTSYTIREVFSGQVAKKVHHPSAPYWFYDTTFVAADTSYIFLQENKNHDLTTVGMKPSPYRSYLYFSIARYNPASFPDTASTKIPAYWTSTQSYVRNVGLLLYDWFSSGNHSYREWYKLKAYSVH